MEPLESLDSETEDRREVVLLVEDNFQVRWPTAEYLRDSGYRVIEAVSVEDAITVLASGTGIDVVFSDVNLSGDGSGEGPSGFDLARWLGENRPLIPVLLTSGEAVPRGMQIEFLPKPYALAEAEQRIRQLLARRPAR